MATAVAIPAAETGPLGKVPEPKQNEYHYFKALDKDKPMELTCCYLLVSAKDGTKANCGHKYVCSDSCLTKPRQALREHLASAHGVLLG